MTTLNKRTAEIEINVKCLACDWPMQSDYGMYCSKQSDYGMYCSKQSDYCMYCSNKKCVNHEGVSHMQGYMQGDPPRWVKSSSANNIQPISEKIETFDPIHDVPGTDEQVQIAFADANNPLKASIMSENSLNLTVQQQVWLAVYVALADKHVSPCCAALANEAVEEFGKAFPVYRSSQIEDSQ